MERTHIPGLGDDQGLPQETFFSASPRCPVKGDVRKSTGAKPRLHLGDVATLGP